jgi:hypothetical protein
MVCARAKIRSAKFESAGIKNLERLSVDPKSAVREQSRKVRPSATLGGSFLKALAFELGSARGF